MDWSIVPMDQTSHMDARVDAISMNLHASKFISFVYKKNFFYIARSSYLFFYIFSEIIDALQRVQNVMELMIAGTTVTKDIARIMLCSIYKS